MAADWSQFYWMLGHFGCFCAMLWLVPKLDFQRILLQLCAKDAYVFHPGISAGDYNIEDGHSIISLQLGMDCGWATGPKRGRSSR